MDIDRLSKDIMAHIEGLVGEEHDTWKPSGTKESMSHELLDAVIDFENHKCSIKVGDLVTPTKTSIVKGRGKPFRVMEVFNPPKMVTRGEGNLLHQVDCVTAVMLDGRLHQYQGSSKEFELFEM